MTRDVDTPSPLLIDLNPIQKEAVLHTDGPVLIVAGAGSGKTRALTHRIAYLIREQDVSPYAILAITFTNKAAQEMAERVEGLMGSRIAKGMWILTFHSACVRILRREHEHLGLPSSFTIYDENDTERVIALVEKQMDLDPKRYPIRQVAAMIGHAKDQLGSARRTTRARTRKFFERTVADVYAHYQRRLQPAGALDFDDIIMQTVRLFREHPEVLVHYQERFRYILIDEYQDTNRAQYSWSTCWPPGTGICVWSATPTRASTRGAERPSRTCWTSSTTTQTPRSSSWTRTTGPRRRSWRWRTP